MIINTYTIGTRRQITSSIIIELRIIPKSRLVRSPSGSYGENDIAGQLTSKTPSIIQLVVFDVEILPVWNAVTVEHPQLGIVGPVVIVVLGYVAHVGVGDGEAEWVACVFPEDAAVGGGEGDVE